MHTWCSVINYDIDIWTAAQLMVKRYGDDALQQAVKRAGDLSDAGDVKGAYIWYLVRNCIERLQAKAPAKGEKVH